MPIADYCLAGGHPTFLACPVIRSPKKKNADHYFFNIVAVCSLFSGRGAAAKLAYAFRTSNRNVFDEWIFNFQGA